MGARRRGAARRSHGRLRHGAGLRFKLGLETNRAVGRFAVFAGSRDRRFVGWPVRLLGWDIVYIPTVFLSQVSARQTARSSQSGEYRLFRLIPRYLDIECAHMAQVE